MFKEKNMRIEFKEVSKIYYKGLNKVEALNKVIGSSLAPEL